MASADGTNIQFTSAGTSGQVLTSAGAGAPTWAYLPSYINSNTTALSGTVYYADTSAASFTLSSKSVQNSRNFSPIKKARQ
jgi:hypothetical protein